ncbi:MAG: T9SS type A sorting domain-containing protein, partial [Bacteroidales bacterium]
GECLGIGEYANGYKLSIFPNPSSGRFVVKVDSESEGTFDLKVINNKGVEVFHETGIQVSGSFEKEINLPGFAQGVYFINLYNNEINILRKVLIKR